MSETARKVLDAFEALPEPERREVASEIPRRLALSEYAPLEDVDLVALADEVFRDLDHAEESR